MGRDPSVTSFSSATLTPSSTCPSLADSRCSSMDQKWINLHSFIQLVSLSISAEWLSGYHPNANSFCFSLKDSREQLPCLQSFLLWLWKLPNGSQSGDLLPGTGWKERVPQLGAWYWRNEARVSANMSALSFFFLSRAFLCGAVGKKSMLDAFFSDLQKSSCICI